MITPAPIPTPPSPVATPVPTALSTKEKFGVLGVIVLLVVLGLFASFSIGETSSIPQFLPLAVSLVLASFTTLMFVGLIQAISMLGFTFLVTFFGTGDVTSEQVIDAFNRFINLVFGQSEGSAGGQVER